MNSKIANLKFKVSSRIIYNQINTKELVIFNTSTGKVHVIKGEVVEIFKYLLKPKSTKQVFQKFYKLIKVKNKLAETFVKKTLLDFQNHQIIVKK